MNDIKSRAKKRKSKIDFMRYLASIYKATTKPALKLAKKFGERSGSKDFACNLMMPYSMAVEEESNCYVTYDLYPKKAEDQNGWLYYTGESAKDCCIVMQGPIRQQEDFTLETVRFYKRVFPKVLIIVSTWEGEDTLKIEKETGCVVVKSKLPVKSGISNINYQAFSSYAGAKRAKELGKKFLLKTRTDSRITMPGILEMLCDLEKRYPVKAGSKDMQGRIVYFGAYLFMPYNDYAIYYFGYVDDMLEFFDAPLHEGESIKNQSEMYMQRNACYENMFDEGSALNYLSKCYFTKKIGQVSCNLNEWWDVLSRYAICLPVAMLRPLWLRYDYNHEMSDMTWIYRRKILGSTGLDNTLVDYAMWSQMMNGTLQIEAKDYEYLMKQSLK